MSSVLKSKRNESKHFKIFEQASQLRTEVTRYILHDFDSDGPLAFLGEDWLDDERLEINRDLRNIYGYAQEANAVHMRTIKDYVTRRNFINLSIAAAKRLSGEFKWIVESFSNRINVDKYVRVSGTLGVEIKLLKGWRRQTDKQSEYQHRALMSRSSTGYISYLKEHDNENVILSAQES